MKFKKLNKILRTTLCSIAATQCLGCVEDIVPEREVRDYGSFGTELYNIVYDNSVHSKDHSSERFLSTFRSYRESFIDAVDTSAVPDKLDDFNQVFIDIVPLYENMLYPGTLRKVATAADEFRNDPAALSALTWFIETPSIFANQSSANPLGKVFEYEHIVEATDELMALLLRNGKTPEAATNLLLRELSHEMADLGLDEDSRWFTSKLITTLTTPKSVYAPQGSTSPQTVARLDDHANPVPDTSFAQILQPSPVFPGYFQYQQDLIAPFERRTTTAPIQVTPGLAAINGTQAFETLDLQQTMLAYLVRESGPLFEDDTIEKALRAFQALLGEPVAYQDARGRYTAYRQDSPTMQLIAALLTTLDHESVGANFEAIIQVLENHQDVAARLVHDLDSLLTILDETPNNFSGDNDLIDRLIPEVLKIAQDPGLLEALFDALDDPRAAKIAPFLAELAERTKTFIEVPQDGPYNQCFLACDNTYKVGTFERMDCIRACPVDTILGTKKTDFNAPESLENRSLFQRTTHLMWETSETPYDVYAESLIVADTDISPVGQSLGPLITFDNLAAAYLKTITGDLHLEEHISPKFIQIAGLIGLDGATVTSLLTLLTDNLFGLKLSVHPTTAEVTRLFNRSDITAKTSYFTLGLNTADCRSGFKCLDVNADVLYAIEATGLVDALYPLIDVFNKHDKTDILARIIATIFEYYPTGAVEYKDSLGKPLNLHPSDFRSLEPMLIRALRETDIVADVGAFGDALLAVQLSDGAKLSARFEKFVRYLLTPNPAIRKIDGSAQTKDPAGNPIAPLSPAYLYIDAIRDLSDFFDTHETTKDQLSDVASKLADMTIRTTKHPDGSITFDKPAGAQVAADAVRMLLDIYREKWEDKTLSAWIHQTAIPNTQMVFSNRVLHPLLLMFNDLDNRNGFPKIRGLASHLQKNAATELQGTAYWLLTRLLVQDKISALSSFTSKLIDPDRVWTTEGFSQYSFVITMLLCFDAFNSADPKHVFNDVFHRLLETDTKPRPNIARLFDVAHDLFRVDVGSGNVRTPQDMRVLFDFIYDLFTDDDRGVERIYGVIDFTIWGNDRRPKDWKPEDASWQIIY